MPIILRGPFLSVVPHRQNYEGNRTATSKSIFINTTYFLPQVLRKVVKFQCIHILHFIDSRFKQIPFCD